MIRCILLATLAPAWMLLAAEPDRPNILWITSEDNSPYLGCYGDLQARTPHLDRFSGQGVRYLNAFSSAPVCSAARSTLADTLYVMRRSIPPSGSRNRNAWIK